MPSPIAHTLAAVSIYAVCTVKKKNNISLPNIKELLLLSFFSVFPDIDFIIFVIYPEADPDIHRGFTHSLLFPILMFFIAFLKYRGKEIEGTRIDFLVFYLVLSHIILDMFVQDGYHLADQALLWPYQGRFTFNKYVVLFDPLNWADPAGFYSITTLKSLGKELVVGTFIYFSTAIFLKFNIKRV